MQCILCYNSPILNLNPKTQARRGLIIYNTSSGIIALRKHVHVNHSICFLIEEEVNNLLKEKKRQLAKKKANMSISSISNFFATKEPFKKKWFVAKKIIGGYEISNYQKPSSFAICGKYL
jgi:hypothetical protein